MMFEQRRTWAKARMSHAGRALRLSISLASAFALVGCGGNDGGDTGITVVPAAAPAPVPVPTPTPTATPSPAADATSLLAKSLEGLDPIASNIDVASYLTKSWGTGEIARSGSPEQVGAFRFLCTPSHNAYDDPIVFPGQPGRAHLHTFFGNTNANAHSTYQSLRTTGDSTCNNLLNRSAYWVPAMMTPAGKVVMPHHIAVYYKRRPSTDPYCTREAIACISLPRGLRYVFGYNMANPTPNPPIDYICENGNTPSKSYKNIPEVAKACPTGASIIAHVTAPSCWNGRDLDSVDHHSHMAYVSSGSWGYEKCPATHPYVIPTFTLAIAYVIDESLDHSGDTSPNAKTWYLSSDRMPGMPWQTPGTTLHADWFGAWDDSVMKMWTENCINLLLSCAGGDLGNGQQLKMLSGYASPAGTHLVDPPAKL